ncbi:hypothetical protein JVU11DRAFT_8833 [Chiua virens]|nr:hypothetical protein JVU11DRAFT_8833 [Chiua virens]
MFATLSAFLPSTLQQVTPQATSPPDPLESLPSTPPAPAPCPDPPRKKDKKEKHPNEAFIIVRPPPSKSAQPLSLQVQLVPPQSRNDRPVQALDSSPDDLNTDLRRTRSDRSENSAYSNYTSGSGSVSSFSSTSTTSSGRRTIIPLYNLNVHAVMPTTILDAGTDAKVAKFVKRGLEVVGLAFLEPIEVRPSPASGSISARPSLDGSLRELGSTPTRRPVSPARPNTARPTTTSSGDDFQKPTINLFLAPPLPPPDMPSPRSTKKLFSKMFRKKDTAQPLSIAVPLPDDIITPQSSPLPNFARRSVEAPVSHPDTPHYPDTWPSIPSVTTSQTTVLGVHPALYPPVSHPKGRPIKYIWVVRKWLKGTDSGILNGMMGKLSAGPRDASPLSTPQIEVRFEWCREDKKSTGRKTRVDKTPNLQTVNTRSTSQTLTPDTRDKRCSLISQASSGSETPSLLSSAHQNAEERDEDSDPEDSETPWTCSVAVQRLVELSPHHRQNAVREPAVRLKVATLAPTPHHPKIVGLLKMPFPLPDIEVERLVVRRRVVTTQGVSKTTAPSAGEFVLTAEEIKDTVSSTALWLVVREAFGGVGKERKKGKS